MTKTGLKVVGHVSIGLPLDSIGLLHGNRRVVYEVPQGCDMVAKGRQELQ